MEAPSSASSIKTALLIQHLARWASRAGDMKRLTASQMAALRFFKHFNKMSHTVSGFADFNATTRGSASQTIHSLQDLGLLSARPDPADHRRIIFELSEAGQDAARNDPLQLFADALSALPPELFRALEIALEEVHEVVSSSRDKSTMGTCSNCAFLRECFNVEESEVLFFCSRAREFLTDKDLDILCVHHETGSA